MQLLFFSLFFFFFFSVSSHFFMIVFLLSFVFQDFFQKEEVRKERKIERKGIIIKLFCQK